MLDSVPSQRLPDLCTSIVKASQAEKIQVLDAINLRERFQKTLPLLMRQIEVRSLVVRPPLEIIVFPVQRPGDLKHFLHIDLYFQNFSFFS